LDNIEAIKILKQIKDILLHNNSWLESTYNPIAESFDIAIKSLEDKEKNGVNNTTSN
jgi:hypothetical protein